MRWNTSDRCVTCKATGDLIDDPIYAGLCGECGEECCARCGLVEGDVDGNAWTCGPCREASDLKDNLCALARITYRNLPTRPQSNCTGSAFCADNDIDT